MSSLIHQLALPRGLTRHTASTGAIVAILLGRLGLTINAAIRLYCELIPQIFGSASLTMAGRANINRITGTARYSGDIFRNNLINVLRGLGLEEDTPLFDPNRAFDPNVSCRTAVVATFTSNGRVPQVFRSYVEPGTVDMHDHCTIWECIRASTAAPTYFPETIIDSMPYSDGGLTANNPAELACADADRIWNNRAIGCLVSLGTGFESAVNVSTQWRMYGFVTRDIPSIATSTRAVDEAMGRRFRQISGENRRYFRFDPSDIRNKVDMDAHREIDLQRLLSLTSAWLQGHKQQEDCVAAATALEALSPGLLAAVRPGE